MHPLASRLLSAVDLSSIHNQADSTSHSGATPLVIVAIVLFIAAIVVRKVIKLAIIVVIAGIVALLFAGWRGGLFG